MTPKLLQLYALRAMVDSLIAGEEAEAGLLLRPGECPHPEEKRISTTTLGSEPSFRCAQCMADVKGQA